MVAHFPYGQNYLKTDSEVPEKKTKSEELIEKTQEFASRFDKEISQKNVYHIMQKFYHKDTRLHDLPLKSNVDIPACEEVRKTKISGTKYLYMTLKTLILDPLKEISSTMKMHSSMQAL